MMNLLLKGEWILKNKYTKKILKKAKDDLQRRQPIIEDN